MSRRSVKDVQIDENLPESLRWLLNVSPVPEGAHKKCADSGLCWSLTFCGVSCGALQSKCALLPLEYHEIAKEEKKVLEPIKVALMPTDNKSLAAGEDWVFEEDEVTEVLE